jgi:hypothetical protein
MPEAGYQRPDAEELFGYRSKRINGEDYAVDEELAETLTTRLCIRSVRRACPD